MLFKNYTPENKRMEPPKVVVCRYFSCPKGVFSRFHVCLLGVTYTTNEHLTWLPQKTNHAHILASAYIKPGSYLVPWLNTPILVCNEGNPFLIFTVTDSAGPQSPR